MMGNTTARPTLGSGPLTPMMPATIRNHRWMRTGNPNNENRSPPPPLPGIGSIASEGIGEATPPVRQPSSLPKMPTKLTISPG